jgi:hypothetical protein
VSHAGGVTGGELSLFLLFQKKGSLHSTDIFRPVPGLFWLLRPPTARAA